MPLHMRLPKLKGFKNRFRVEYQVVNLDRLAELFPQGGPVGADELVEAGAVRKGQPVKVLGTGDLGGVKLEVSAHAFSASAKEKIAAAGGSATSCTTSACAVQLPATGGRHVAGAATRRSAPVRRVLLPGPRTRL